ncbi:MAG: hypothetical protein ACTSU5_16565 [Promethearchaeota archaeon]
MTRVRGKTIGEWCLDCDQRGGLVRFELDQVVCESHSFEKTKKLKKLDAMKNERENGMPPRGRRRVGRRENVLHDVGIEAEKKTEE